MDISPKLQMNLHPKDADNLSLVTAINVKLSNDGSCITNEESIVSNEVITDFITDYYNDNDFIIIGVIPCNNELIIITTKRNSTEAQIFRYKEQTSTQDESIKCVYGNKDGIYLKYHGGKIKGTFTYNVENSLVIAIAEYDGNEEKIPLRVINLGNYENDEIYNDRHLPDSTLSVSPEVRIPSMSNVNYVVGDAYKGWYYVFIRFKINSIDYTQWYNFGYPIYVDTIEKFNIIKYCYNRDTQFNQDNIDSIVLPNSPNCGYVAGCSDYFSNKLDIAKETFAFDINFDNIVFDKYQIGIVCASKSFTKAFRTHDIIKQGNVDTFSFNINSLIDCSVGEFIIDNYNYFDVRNIINYKNRLYISNYKENNINENIDKNIIDDISVDIVAESIETNEIVYNKSILSKSNNQSDQYDSNNKYYIPFTKFFNCDDNTSFTIKVQHEGSTDIIETTETANNLFFTSYRTDDNDDVGRRGIDFGYLVIDRYEYKGLGTYSRDSVSYSKSTVVIHNNDNVDAKDYYINPKTTALIQGTLYLNPNLDFNKRKLTSTLIPGEIYNFFIHYVDKYGHSTNGYRINNKYKWVAEKIEADGISRIEDIVPIKFYSKSKNKYLYAAIGLDVNVSDGNNLIIPSYMNIFETIDNFKLTDDVTSEDTIKEFINYFDTFANNKYVATKWFQIAPPIPYLMPYINNNGERLFRVPFVDDISMPNMFFGFYDITLNSMIKHKYYPSFYNVTIPDGYVGFFISYEKYESTLKYTGLLTRNDFRNQDYVKDNIKNTANTCKSDYVNFYCSRFDIDDSIKLDYNVLRIEGENVFKYADIFEYDYMQISKAFAYPNDMNKPQIGAGGFIKNYAISDCKLAVANSHINNRMGLGTCLKIKDDYNIFPIYETSSDKHNNIKLFKVSLCNYSRNIYMSNNKTLIRLTDITYKNGSITKYRVDARCGLPGHITNDGFIVYENSGYSHNDADNIVRRYNENTKYYQTSVSNKNPHTYANDIPFAAYIQMPVYADKFFESKCFKNDPKGIVYFTKQDTSNLDKANENNKFWGGCLVDPANTIDLFENRQDSSDAFNVKTYTNYREDLVSVDNFEKTVRRSAVIQDETRINGWRTFPVEGYKNITENKGIITNLVGIGTMLLVHTEHSMFLFDTNNALTTNDDKKVQLSQPDAFEVKYVEVLTSTLGYGGLQDDKSFAVGQFGYTFYNNDAHRFYNFDNGKLNVIDGDIIQWLDKYKPYNVRFAEDAVNNRLLIKLEYDFDAYGKTIVLSYNYGVNNFISAHDYTFDESYNTKSKLYMIKRYAGIGNRTMYNFVQDGSSFCDFDIIRTAGNKHKTRSSKIGIIVNNQYDVIKFLESISYKLSKCVSPAVVDYTNSPVEETITPYSGDYIRIYNNEVDTGYLDVLIDKEESKNIFCNYAKPYWDLGMWNYNYLRNKITDYNNYGDAFNMSRLFGNYFVVEFVFSNNDNLKVEFESFKYKIIN